MCPDGQGHVPIHARSRVSGGALSGAGAGGRGDRRAGAAAAVADLLDPLLRDQVTLQQPLRPRPGVVLEQGDVPRTSLELRSYVRS